MRVRHYGFLANCCRRKKLVQIRQLLHHQTEEVAREASHLLNGYPCPKCKKGQMIIIEEMMPTNERVAMAMRR